MVSHDRTASVSTLSTLTLNDEVSQQRLEIAPFAETRIGWTGILFLLWLVHAQLCIIQTTFQNAADQRVFKLARKYIKPSWTFRFATYLVAERKLLVMFLTHFVCTMVIWAHFGLIKFQQQEEMVPAGANRYWWKRIVPPLEFGSMHAILFQMALFPLTMSRLSITAASSSFLDRFVPLNRMLRVHVHLGYTMLSIVFLATVVFFAFFGLLCTDGEDQFCKKFTDEIMITGYFLVGLLLIVGITSYVRYSIMYEVFYGIHHLVFVIYALGIAHTLDIAERTNQRDRSQTFKWYSATLLYYFCDRAAMYMNHRHHSSIASSSAVTSSKGIRMVIVNLHRPALFMFKPGQYCMLRISSIDAHWHPFSIASDPDSDYLEFYMEVYGETSWTNKLWNMVNPENDGASCSDQDLVTNCNMRIGVEVKGPYGTSLGRPEDFSHALAIGSGTGIVPILSLLKQHVKQIMRLEPDAFFKEQERYDRKIHHVYMEQQTKRGPLLGCCRRDSVPPSSEEHRRQSRRTPPEDNTASVDMTRTDERGISSEIRTLPSIRNKRKRKMTLAEIRRRSSIARMPIYDAFSLMFLPPFGVTMIGLTLSWNTIPIELYSGMDTVLEIGTVIFQALFAFVAMLVHDRSHFLTYVDIVIVIVSAFVDWYWFAKDLWVNFSAGDMVYFSLLMLYMTLRSWYTAVQSQSKSWRKEVSHGGFVTLDKLDFIWVTRSASLVSKIMPDIVRLWDGLCEAWGEEAARKVCEISLYVTDKDEDACAALQSEMGSSSLYSSGAVKFKRPDMQELIEHHSLERINERRRVHSSTLLAFCGSASLSAHIGKAKIANDVSTVITGNALHRMEFVSESYGPYKARDKTAYPVQSGGESSEYPDSCLPQKHCIRSHPSAKEGFVDENQDSC